MKRLPVLCLVAAAFSALAAGSFAIYIPPTHYEKPPAKES